ERRRGLLMPTRNHLMRSIVFGLAISALATAAARAQSVPGQFTVGAHGGYTHFDAASALRNAPFAGIDATYEMAGKSLRLPAALDLGIGFTIATSRPVTRYDQFPAVSFDFGDTTFLRGVAQRI